MADFIVNIDVDDREKAAVFYCQGLGLSRGRRFPGTIELLGGPTPIYLLEKPAGSAAAPGGKTGRSYDRHWTPAHLDFVVDDVDAAVEKAVRAGASLEKPAASRSWGRIAMLADPFGNGFCLIQFSGRGYDAIAEPDG